MRVAAGAGVVEKGRAAVGKRCCIEGEEAAGRRNDGASRLRSMGIAIVSGQSGHNAVRGDAGDGVSGQPDVSNGELLTARDLPCISSKRPTYSNGPCLGRSVLEQSSVTCQIDGRATQPRHPCNPGSWGVVAWGYAEDNHPEATTQYVRCTVISTTLGLVPSDRCVSISSVGLVPWFLFF